jgi:hypothetical protein
VKGAPAHRRESILSLTYTGTLEFDTGVDITALIAHLADYLRKLDARNIRTSYTSVSFRGGLFRTVSSGNILIPFGYGELIVDETAHEVGYGLCFRQLICVVTTLLGLGYVAEWPVTRFEPVVPLVLGISWLSLVGGNLMIGIPRFQRFLRSAIDSLPFPQ